MSQLLLSTDMPWTSSWEQERRFRRLTWRLLLALLLICLLVPFLPLPELDKTEVVELPPRLAQLLLDRQKAPPPVVEQAKPEEKPAKKPEEKKPEKKPAEKKPEPPKPQKSSVEAAREKVANLGVLALADDLADLRDDSFTENLAAQKPLTNAKQVTADPAAGGSAAEVISATAAAQGSGGINTGNLSRSTGGSGLQGRGTSKVTSASASQSAAAAGQTAGGGGKRTAARSLEEIQEVIDRNKSSLFSIYNRELRKNPTLRGKLVVAITITPQGKVSNAVVVSSELHDPALEQKILTRIKLINFGAKDVDAVTTNLPIDFFPA